MRRIGTIAISACCLLRSGAYAADTDIWFQRHPQPPVWELTPEEFGFLNPPGTHLDYTTPGCGDYLEKAFTVYLGRYPAYAGDNADRDALFQRWQNYAEISEVSRLPFCLTAPYAYQLKTLADAPESAITISYCGRYSGEDSTADDSRARALIDEVERIARRGSVSAFSSYLELDGDTEVVRLNPDILYFLKQSLMNASPILRPDYLFDNERVWADDAWNRPDLEQQLSPKRKAFVDDAAARNDLGSVLATTGPCGDTAWREAD
nr:hypothetical protein [Marinicella sp. W31]MDC2877778.1 hypothetical protein [Marinicella sp. W31]